MPYRLVESSSDVVIEAEGPDLGAALVGLAQGFSHVVTAGSVLEPRRERTLRVRVEGDLPALAVAFLNEVIYLFDTEGFLPIEGRLAVVAEAGSAEAQGTLRGDTYDPARHELGNEVKAATMHEAAFGPSGPGARARVLVDL